MLRKTPWTSLVALCLSAVCGCERPLSKPTVQAPPKLPIELEGTVAEHAYMFGGGSMDAQAYGIVVRLGNNGSSEVPPRIRAHLIEYLRKQNLGSARHGTEEISPARILNDKDTAVVLVEGTIPPGAPAGTRFDVVVTALPQTQTRSLDGGVLMPIELSMALGGGSLVQGAKVLARASGPVFVNPFLDPTKPAESAKFRTGRILNGAVVTEDRPIRLILRQPDYGRCSLIERRIRERFGEVEHGLGPARKKIANAIGADTLEVSIPPQWQDDYLHFLQLILHLPLDPTHGAADAKARQVAEALQLPGARHEDLALIWEAMGRQVVPLIQPLYTSKNAAVAFYAARTGLRLGDVALAGPVMIRFAASANSRHQLAAIEELGKPRKVIQALQTLRTLIDDPNELVRIAAYESLVRLGDMTTVQRMDIEGEFQVDIVRSSRGYVIYATQTGQPKVVLFGQNMVARKPMFYNAPDDLVTINARENSEKLMVFRKIQRTGQYSDTLQSDFAVRKLIETLGRLDQDDAGRMRGLGLSYGQIVGTLQRMCKEGDIPAKFVLQTAPEMEKLYTGFATTGRPD